MHLHKAARLLKRLVREVPPHVAPLDELRKKPLREPSVLYPNPGAPIEWWYFNGHLTSGTKRFSYCTTIFKIHPALLHLGPLPLPPLAPQMFFVHTSLGDQQRKTFVSSEHLEVPDRGNRLHIKLEDTTLDYQEKTFTLT